MSEIEWRDNVVISKKFSKEQLLPLFEPNSFFMKKLKVAPFCGELGTPIKEPGMTTLGWGNRLARIDMDKVCVLIKEPRINDEDQLIAKVKFIGPLKETLETALNNGTITMGVRALVDNDKIIDISAFDVIGYE